MVLDTEIVVQIESRWYLSEDFESIMNFLRETYSITGSLQNWPPTRFENSSSEMRGKSRIWEAIDGQSRIIVALATPEVRLRYFIQIHPDYSHLEAEIIDWIEHHCNEQASGLLSVVTLEGNRERGKMLRSKGFAKGNIYGIQRLRDPNVLMLDRQLPNGFKMRNVEPNDFDEIAIAIRKVFGHGDWFTREILEEISKASFYHKELDLVAIDDKGTIVSFCTFRLDILSGIAELEPIGTLPEYRRRGLARALICEGLKRLRKYNALLLCIEGAADTPAANRLYEETGFTTRHYYYTWQKQLRNSPLDQV